jgi:uncharacterized protein YueI
MENTFEFQLIDGEFKASDAARVVLPLINDKINFHVLERFSDKIRNDKENEHAKKRIEALNLASDNLKEFIQIAMQNDLKVTIKSKVEIILEQ